MRGAPNAVGSNIFVIPNFDLEIHRKLGFNRVNLVKGKAWAGFVA
jgi:hypothetical protein